MKLTKIITIYTLLIAFWLAELSTTNFITANGWLAAILIYSAYVADKYGEGE